MKVRFRGSEYAVKFEKYSNGRTAIVLVGADGESAAVASVNVPEAPLKANQLLIKDYSENAGILAALEKAGVVKTLGVCFRLGHVSVPVCELLVDPAGAEQANNRRAGSREKSRDRGLER